jgi:hypothetical protein
MLFRLSSVSAELWSVAIHTGGLPGTPNAARGVDAIAEECAAEAQMYAAAGFHGVVIENTHDRPYLKGSVGPEIAAALAVIGYQALASSSAIAERSIAVFNSGIVVWSTQSRSDATSSISWREIRPRSYWANKKRFASPGLIVRNSQFTSSLFMTLSFSAIPRHPGGEHAHFQVSSFD